MRDKIPKEGRILSNYFYTDYVKKYVEKNKKTKTYSFDRDEMRHVLKDIFEAIADEIVEGDNGVYMEGMGYFYIFTSITPYFKSPKSAPKRVMYEFADTNGRRFYLSFNPIGAKSPFRGFSLDFNESDTIKKRIREKARNGKRWKYYLSILLNNKSR